jgi:hypothetical protein
MSWLLVLLVGIAAGTLGGIVGFGSSLVLMPVLVAMFGPKEAVPIMGLAALLANLSRAAVWWREVDWRACAVYALTAAPAAALGARTLVALEPRLVEAALGVFFIAMVPARRWLQARELRVGLGTLAVVGAVIGYLTGIVVSTGPINTPFFLAYGLVKGGFLSTEALSSVAVLLAKLNVLRQYGLVPWDTLVRGLVIGSSLMLGSWLAKRFVQRLDPSHFRLIMDALMLLVGAGMLAGALVW